MRRFSLLLLALVPVAIQAQVALERPGQYPEFRSISGLPGGGFGVLRNGTPDISGAMALSTPIGYTLGHDSFFLAGADTSNNGTFSFPVLTKRNGDVFPNGGNGTGVAMFGTTTPIGEVSATFELLSGQFNSVYNFQWTPKQAPESEQGATFSLGVQDIRGHGGTGGNAYDNSHTGWTSRSTYVAATRQVCDNAFVSVGVGANRFRTVFGNASYGFAKRFKAVGEYDGFNFNYGLAADLGRFNFYAGRDAHVIAFLGAVDGKYATWTLGFTF